MNIFQNILIKSEEHSQQDRGSVQQQKEPDFGFYNKANTRTNPRSRVR